MGKRVLGGWLLVLVWFVDIELLLFFTVGFAVNILPNIEFIFGGWFNLGYVMVGLLWDG